MGDSILWVRDCIRRRAAIKVIKTGQGDPQSMGRPAMIIRGSSVQLTLNPIPAFAHAAQANRRENDKTGRPHAHVRADPK